MSRVNGTRRDGASASPTLDEVARVAGVSRATASRAINGGQRVSPRAQSSVDAAVRSLGYVPNPAARSRVWHVWLLAVPSRASLCRNLQQTGGFLFFQSRPLT